MKKKLLTLLIGVSVVVTLVTMPLMTACAPEEVAPPEVPEEPEEAPETIKIGAILPLSGPAAMWGLPAKTGFAIWEDEVEAAGGIKVGDKRYLVDIVLYDDEYTGHKSLAGAKKLVLDDEVVMIMIQSGPPVTAAAPFLTEQKIITFQGNGFETLPDRPYLLSVGDNWPLMDAMELEYLADAHPEIKSIAFACQDDELGEYSIALVKAMAEAKGWDLVYAKLFGTATVDFAPIMAAMLAGDPDLIAFGGIWGDFRASLLEQAYLLGVGKGDVLFQASEWDLGADTVKLPAGYLEGAVAAQAELDDPLLPASSHEFWDKWQARFGPGAPEDVGYSLMVVDWGFYNMIKIWEYGLALAGTFDGPAVTNALLAQETIPHMMGPAPWWGEDLYGVNHSLAVPQYITEVKGQKHVSIGTIDILDWFEANREFLLKWYTEYGLLWHQR